MTSWPPELGPLREPPPVTWPVLQILADRGGSTVTMRQENPELRIGKIDLDGIECTHFRYGTFVTCHADRSPEELAGKTAHVFAVSAVMALHDKRSLYEACEHARCNPPPPAAHRQIPSRRTSSTILEMTRDGEWTRVLLQRFDDLQDLSWHAVFLDDAGIELSDGACVITDWGSELLECATALPPGKYGVELRPPTRTARRARVLAIQGNTVRILRRRDDDRHEKMLLEANGETCELAGDHCELPHEITADTPVFWYPKNNPPQDDPLEVPLERLSVERGAVRVEFARGATNGLEVGNPVELRTADDKVQDRCTLDRVDPQHASCLVTSTHDQMRPIAHAIVIR